MSWNSLPVQVEDNNTSLLASIGNSIAWVFAPLGWAGGWAWKAAVATITGLVAKEEVVSTFGVLYQYGGELSESGDEIWALIRADFTGLTAWSFMIFNLLCAPCFAAMGAIKREMNNAKWTWFAIGYQCGLAYAVALMVNQIGAAFTGNLNVIGLSAAFVILGGMIYMLFRPYKEATRLTAKVEMNV